MVSRLATSAVQGPLAIEAPQPSAAALHQRDLSPFATSQSSVEERHSFPSLGLDISRPPSTLSQASSILGHDSQQPGLGKTAVHLPGLSSLTSIASTAGDGCGSGNGSGNSSSSSRPIDVAHAMTYATAAPATSGGQGNNPPICQNCTTSTTPLWRRDEMGSVLCNACGLFLKLHGRPRPISLKTDVIKSRNRVKTSGQGPKKKATSDVNNLLASHPASHPDVDPTAAMLNHRRVSGKLPSGASDRSTSPVSRTGTPGLHHPSNIAPQHMFDGVLEGHTFQSPSLAHFNVRQPSPGSASSLNGANMEPPMTSEALTAQNTSLKTRVTELEFINDLFRGRVAELERSEQDARRNEAAAREGESQLRAEVDELHAREAELRRRVEELESELTEYRDGHKHKKMRLSDIVDDSHTSTPLSTPSQSS